MKGIGFESWLTIGCAIGFILVFGWLIFQSPDPGSSILRASKSLTSNPVVSKGRFAFFGCGHGDVFKYDVSTPDGESIGYVCQGWNIIPGLEKGATARFSSK